MSKPVAPDPIVTGTASADRAGFFFIVAGLLMGMLAVGVLVYLVALRTVPSQALWVLGGVAFGCVGVAVFGAILISPHRGGLALQRVQAAAERALPQFGARPLAGSVMAVEVPPGVDLVAERQDAPDVLVRDRGEPVEARQTDTPGAVKEAVAGRRRSRRSDVPPERVVIPNPTAEPAQRRRGRPRSEPETPYRPDGQEEP